MKKMWIIVIGGLLTVGLALCLLTPVNSVLYDPAPSAESVAGTVVLDQPLPPLPPHASTARQAPAAAHSPAVALPNLAPVTTTERLSPHLVMIRQAPVKVPQGVLQLPPGFPVRLARDRGDSVEVIFGHRRQAQHVSVPRNAVANRDVPEEPSLPVIATVRRKIEEVGEVLHAPASSIAVEAKEVGTGRGTARAYDSWTGEIERDQFRTKGLTVTVRNLSRRPTGEVEIDVYWTGRRLSDNGLHVTHCETFRTSLGGVSEHQETSWCPLLDANTRTWTWTNERRVSGSKFDGWFVVVRRDDQMLVGRGATENYNHLLRNPVQLQPLLASWAGSSQHATANRPLWRHERPGKSAVPQDKRGGGTLPY